VTGRCTGRGHGLTECVRLVQSSSQARRLGFATDASGHSRDWSVRSGTQRNSAWRRAERTRGASDHEGCLLDSDRTLVLSHLVVVWSTSGRCVRRRCAIMRPVVLSGASGRRV
jgi:hypothetical protein